MKKRVNIAWVMVLTLLGAGITYAQTADEPETVIPDDKDAGSINDNIAQMWEELDAVVTAECQDATDGELNSPEEVTANSAACAEAGRFFQTAKNRAYAAVADELASDETSDTEIAKEEIVEKDSKPQEETAQMAPADEPIHK